MRFRASLFARILFWSFLDLALVGAVLFAFLRLQFLLPPESPLFAGNRFDFVAAHLADDLRDAPAGQRNAVLATYASRYGDDFLLFDDDGAQLAGTPTVVPPEVAAYLGRPGSPGRPLRSRPGVGPTFGPRGARGPGGQGLGPGGQGLGPGGRGLGPGGQGFGQGFGQPIFQVRTTGPTRYWLGKRMPLFDPGEPRPSMASLLVVSDSISGHGLFFDVRPWIYVVSAIVLLSILLWLPFVRGLTRTIGQMTTAAEQIASGRFDARVDVRRSDELGRLARSIDQLSARLAGFVGGQRRFLGDISHELNSPLARLDVALGILEERLAEQDRPMVADAQEEVRLMSELVAELLAFAKAGIKGQEVRLSDVALRPLVDAVVAREAAGHDVGVDVDGELSAAAQPQLLARALANLLRNAARYAGDGGPITISARRRDDRVAIAVTDRGPGVPEDALSRLFDPFFRIEADRDRATGGAGLGLAIVKTCVDACGGTVTARNLAPVGFEVEITLAARQP